MRSMALRSPLTLGHRGLHKRRMSTDFGLDNSKTLRSWAAANHAELCETDAALAGAAPRLVIDEDPTSGLKVYKLVPEAFSANQRLGSSMKASSMPVMLWTKPWWPYGGR